MTFSQPVKYAKISTLLFGSKGSSDGEFNQPRAAVMYRDELNVADFDNCRICVYSLRGTFIRSYSLPHQPLDLAVGPEGKLIVSVYNQLLVVRGHKVVSSIGSTGYKPGEFSGACGVTCGPDGVIYVIDLPNSCVKCMRMSGEVVRIIDAAGKGKLKMPVSVAIEPSTGNLFVASRKMQAILIYTPEGRYKNRITADNVQGARFDPAYVSFREDDLLAVSDVTSNCVYLMRSTTHVQTHVQTLGGRGQEPGEFNWPLGTVFTDAGLIVADKRNHRIQVFQDE